jgi:hypothetical protein
MWMIRAGRGGKLVDDAIPKGVVVYPMEAGLRLLLDANVVGEARVFGLESLAADRLWAVTTCALHSM